MVTETAGRATTESPMWLTRGDLAAMLRVSVRTVDQMRDRSELPAPAVDRPRMVRWSRQDIERWDRWGRPRSDAFARRARREGGSA